ncbi:MAG TPA: glycine--tRNA ligase subunit beta [Terriglobales bacterium]|jgi:glycyl-tRNA synthetase beta chain|nr:glycine--tRNA ligase subunit beta [Terriglobales bacterium]
MSDLLIEIGCEEIPARMLDAAREEFGKRVTDLLQRERLTVQRAEAAISSFSTPRRLAVLARHVSSQQPNVEEQLIGPATKVAFKDGNPTPAAEAFARKAGVDIAKLEKITNPKGEYLAATVVRKGRSAAEILAEALPKELNALYWAKNMYWRAFKPERFVRPVRWIVALLDDESLPLEYAGVKAGNRSRGHRILTAAPVTISGANEYVEELKASKVVADPAERLTQIRKALDSETRKVSGACWREDAELLNTVVNLTEFPGVILGSFDRAFLSLPEEVLVTVMRDHQKYFAVEDASGKLAPHFLAVLNTDGDRDGVIRHGNERVLRARFNDAQFFWQTDQKIPLMERVEMLRSVTFQKDLGSYWSKTERIRAAVSSLIDALAKKGVTVSKATADKAALLAKTDLTTELVKEFTELQGIVGGLYARAQGHPEGVADAIYDHYRPESAEDPAPRSLEGAIVSTADKADSIAGMFALGLQPSGSKDPFALRRQANGIVRILAEHNLPLSFEEIFSAALEQYRTATELQGKLRDLEETYTAIAQFLRERLEFYLRDVRGFAYDVVNAVLSADANHVVDAIQRAEAVSAVRLTDDFIAISTAFKRIKNILRQAREGGKKWPDEFKSDHLKEPAEQALGARVTETRDKVLSLRKGRHYQETLNHIAQLRPVVDTFFDKVMVMVEDDKLRSNRLALLATMQRSFSEIADFSEIVTEKAASA